MCEEGKEAARAVGQIEGKLSGLMYQSDKHYDRMNRIDEEHAELSNKLDKVEHRLLSAISGLSIKVYSIIAVASVLATLASILMRFLK